MSVSMSDGVNAQLFATLKGQIEDADRLLKSTERLGKLRTPTSKKVQEIEKRLTGLVQSYVIRKNLKESLSITWSKETNEAFSTLEDKIGNLKTRCAELRDRISPPSSKKRAASAQPEPQEPAPNPDLASSSEKPSEKPAPPQQKRRKFADQVRDTLSAMKTATRGALTRVRYSSRNTNPTALTSMAVIGSGAAHSVGVVGGLGRAAQLSMATQLTATWLFPASMAAVLAHRAQNWNRSQLIVGGVAAGVAALGLFTLAPVGIPGIAIGGTAGIFGSSLVAGEAAGRFARKPEEEKKPPANPN